MGFDLEHLLALVLQRMIHGCGEGRCHSGRTVLDEQAREVVDRRTLILAGNRRFLLGGVSTSKTNLDDQALQLGPPMGTRPRLARLNSDGHPPATYKMNVGLLDHPVTHPERSYSWLLMESDIIASQSLAFPPTQFPLLMPGIPCHKSPTHP